MMSRLEKGVCKIISHSVSLRLPVELTDRLSEPNDLVLICWVGLMAQFIRRQQQQHSFGERNPPPVGPVGGPGGGGGSGGGGGRMHEVDVGRGGVATGGGGWKWWR